MRTGRRSRLLSALALVLIASGLAVTGDAEAQPVDLTVPGTSPARIGLPPSIAVLGDSISQATGSDEGGIDGTSMQGGGIGAERPRNSWATGDWPGLNSYLQRVRAIPGGSGTVGINLSANGANMRNNFASQARSVPAGTGLVLVQMGGNDLCRPSEAEMTSEADYRAQFRSGLLWLRDNRPDTLVAVFSVPDIYNLWYIRGAAHQGEYIGIWPFGNTAAGPRAARTSADNSPFWARQFWDGFFGSVIPCKSLLVDPTNPRNAGPTPTATHAAEARRLRVRARTIAFNNILAQECAAVLRCRFDGHHTFNFSSNRVNGSLTHNTALWQFVDTDISTQDHFHPSYHGQKKLAQAAYESSYDFTDKTPPVVTAVGSPAPNAAGWNTGSVTVALSATDAAGVRGLEYRLHRPNGTISAWTPHAGSSTNVAVTAAGTTGVEVRALDVNGNRSASRILNVRVDTTAPTATLVSPAKGAVFVENQVVPASYTCADTVSGIASCTGTVAYGQPVDTSTVGTHSFSVTAVDHAGRTTSVQHSYEVLSGYPSVSVDDVEVVEGDTAVFTISASVAPVIPFYVRVRTADGTAIQNEDYEPVPATWVALTLAQPSVQVPVVTIDDGVPELDETFTLRLDRPTNGELAKSIGTATILDNDGAPPEISVDDVIADEGDGNAVFTLSLSEPTNAPVRVRYHTADGTAKAGEDYVALPVTWAEFLPGGPTTLQVAVAIIDDTHAEPDERFTLRLSRPQNATLARDRGFATIIDNDGDLPELSVGDVVVGEGDGPALVPITINRSISKPVSVRYRTVELTASATDDFEPVDLTWVTFEPGGPTTIHVPVTIVDDPHPEPDEQFRVRLANPQRATIDRGIGTVTIVDDDGLPAVLSVGDVVAHQGDTLVNVPVTITGEPGQRVTFNWQTVERTAKAGTDFVAVPRTEVVLEPDGPTTVLLPVELAEGATFDANLQFRVNIRDPRNAVIDRPTATIRLAPAP